MRKYKFPFLCLFFLQICFGAFGQNNQLSISIDGIDYENANLKSLKEALKKTPKVTGLKSSYAENVATLTIDYPGTAEELWDKLPAISKKSFTIVSIDKTDIDLDYNAIQKTTGPANGTTKIITNEKSDLNKKKDDCNSCSYFPLCDYDQTRSFQGKPYYGIDYDGTVIFYRYENGDIIEKEEKFTEQYSYEANLSIRTSIGFNTTIILKCNAPKGTKWLNAAGTQQFEIVEKGINVNLNGTAYKDVLKIRVSMAGALANSSNILGLFGMGQSVNNYYAKGIGLVNTESAAADIEKEKQKKQEIIEQKEKQNKQEVFNKLTSSLKGKIEPIVIGMWKRKNSADGSVTHMQLKKDGTCLVYYGEPEKRNLGQDWIWRLNGNTIEIIATHFYSEGDRVDVLPENLSIVYQTFETMNHPDSKRRLIKIGDRAYLSVDTDQPFSPSEINDKRPDSVIRSIEKELSNMKGVVDPSLAGTWKQSSHLAKIDGGFWPATHIIFYNDGTFKHYIAEVAPENLSTIEKAYWRTGEDFIEQLRTDENSVKTYRNTFQKKSNSKIMIGYSEYTKIN